jgi:hypothetical protein
LKTVFRSVQNFISSHVLLIGALTLLTVLTGCHFVGDSQSAVGTAGLLAGLWDGAVFVWSVVLTCFSDIQVIDQNNSGFLYKVGFAVGALCFGWNLGLFLGLVSFVLYFLPL